jgi:hypothetical protein
MITRSGVGGLSFRSQRLLQRRYRLHTYDYRESFNRRPDEPIGNKYECDGIRYLVNHKAKTLRVVKYSGISPIPCTVYIEGEQYKVTAIGYEGGFDPCDIAELEIPDSVEILEGFANSRIGKIHFSPTTKVKTIIGFQCCSLEVLEFPPSVEIIGEEGYIAVEEMQIAHTF